MYLIPKCEEIKKKREEKGLTRYRLSVLSNLGAYAVARMENNTHKTHILRAKALCNVLECNLNDLFIED